MICSDVWSVALKDVGFEFACHELFDHFIFCGHEVSYCICMLLLHLCFIYKTYICALFEDRTKNGDILIPSPQTMSSFLITQWKMKAIDHIADIITPVVRLWACEIVHDYE